MKLINAGSSVKNKIITAIYAYFLLKNRKQTIKQLYSLRLLVISRLVNQNVYHPLIQFISVANKDLNGAKLKKSDEFYTQLGDIELELKHYKDYFKNKSVF